MFHSITGIVTHASTSSIRLLTGGIEWELETSEFTARALSQRREETRIFAYLHHREDALSLFGFATLEEREIFLELIKVTGIGPKQATRILSGGSPQSIKAAIASSDVDALSGLPGIGKKTAAKIVLALAGKLETTDGGPVGPSSEIVDGLVDMGYERTRATDAVRAAYASVGTGDKAHEEIENEVFRAALVALSKKG